MQSKCHRNLSWGQVSAPLFPGVESDGQVIEVNVFPCNPLLFLLILNCKTPAAHFRHNLDNKIIPCKHERFDNNEDKFPERGRSMDHLMLVTVDDAGVTIASLLVNGILDKTGHIPNDGDHLQYEKPLEE